MKRDFTTGVGCPANYCYFYLHTNGRIIFKKRTSEEELEESPFVQAWWKINTDEVSDMIRMLIRAHTIGTKEDMDDLVRAWNISDADCEVYAKKEGLKYERVGGMWNVYAADIMKAGMSDRLFMALCLFYDTAVHA